MKKFKFDAGHGGKDPGGIGNSLQEKDITLKVVLKMKELMEPYEADVTLTRSTDKYVSLNERTDVANEDDVDYFVSVHVNAGGGEGFESFIHDKLSSTSETSKLRTIVHNEIMKEIGGHDRGKKSKNFHVLRETKHEDDSTIPAILTEIAFIDNGNDAKKLKSDAFLDKVAQGHVNGLVKAFNLKKKKTSSKTESTNHTHHVVKLGDTLSQIARDYKVTVGEILEINPQIKNRNVIYLKQVLNIPTK